MESQRIYELILKLIKNIKVKLKFMIYIYIQALLNIKKIKIFKIHPAINLLIKLKLNLYKDKK